MEIRLNGDEEEYRREILKKEEKKVFFLDEEISQFAISLWSGNSNMHEWNGCIFAQVSLRLREKYDKKRRKTRKTKIDAAKSSHHYDISRTHRPSASVSVYSSKLIISPFPSVVVSAISLSLSSTGEILCHSQPDHKYFLRTQLAVSWVCESRWCELKMR